MREANRSHFCDGRMIGFTELLRHAQCCLAMLAQEMQQILVSDEIGLGRFQHVSCQLIRFPVTAAGKPRTSPASEILRMRLLPSADEVDNLTFPLHKMKTPRGA